MGAASFPGWFESATATDKYTVVIKAHDSEKNPTTYIFERLTEALDMVNPESVQMYGDLHDWKNALGTGPYMLTDYVSSSSATLVRNPNYWRSDPLLPDNKLPYLDTVKYLVIPDISTRMAALRAHQVDVLSTESALTAEQEQSLIKTNPELKQQGGLPSNSWVMFMRTDKPQLPYYDVRVRRALHMAIDFQAIKRDYYGGQAQILWQPVSAAIPGAYTPLEKLPASTQELFQYNPDKAKQLLAEAGFPNGFKTKVLTKPEVASIDLMSIVKDYWSKIGVDLTLDVKDAGLYNSIQAGGKHEEMISYAMGSSGDYQLLVFAVGDPYNMSEVNDPYIIERKGGIYAFENMGKEAIRDKLLNEVQLRALDQAYLIQLPCPYIYSMWQPWVKNYHGEAMSSRVNRYDYVRYTWVDQDLKQQMTGRR